MTTSYWFMAAWWRRRHRRQSFVAVSGKTGWNERVGQDTRIAVALDHVGERLRLLRRQRGVTLTALASTTGISKSTLSRLEMGQRRPTLELLLPLADFYRVPLDDLVGAPEVADPRLRLKPHQRNGRVVLPLTPQPGGVQAWKIVIPMTKIDPELKSHEGYEWMYVLSGRMRLVLGNNDIVVSAGEVVEFDTRVPHWFGSTGDGPVEVLSLLGHQGERMRVRTGPIPKQSSR
jgi:transcriptional regulator with XRE-family HTH domain